MKRVPFVFAAALALAGGPTGAVAQSASAIYDGTNQLVGLWAGTLAGEMEIHSLRGFRFGVLNNGQPGRPVPDIVGAGYSTNAWYTTNDCTGTAYLVVTGSSAVTGLLPGGVVMRLVTDGTPLVYVPKAPTVISITLRAAMEGPNCLPQTPQLFRAVLFLPNDPSITGVPNVDFTPPLRLEVVPLSALNALFGDGFEIQPAQT